MQVTAEDLHLLVLRLDLNTFAPGVFPHAAYFNHSCRPSACVFVIDDDDVSDQDDDGDDEEEEEEEVHGDDDGTVLLEVRAIAPVKTGEQVFISYLSEAQLCLPADQRKRHLSTTYRFNCTCSRCSEPEPYLTAVKAHCTHCSTTMMGHEVDGGYACALCKSALLVEADASSLCDEITATISSLKQAGDEKQATALTALHSRVALTLAPTHWAMKVLRSYHVQILWRLIMAHRADREKTSIVLAWLREYISAETDNLACLTACLTQYDYALSNSHERISQGSHGILSIAEDEPGVVDVHALQLVGDSIKNHYAAVAHIRQVTGWH